MSDKRTLGLALVIVAMAIVGGLALLSRQEKAADTVAAAPSPGYIPPNMWEQLRLDCEYRDPETGAQLVLEGPPTHNEPDPAKRTKAFTPKAAADKTAKKNIKRYDRLVDEGGGKVRVFDGDKRVAIFETESNEDGSYFTAKVTACPESQI